MEIQTKKSHNKKRMTENREMSLICGKYNCGPKSRGGRDRSSLRRYNGE